MNLKLSFSLIGLIVFALPMGINLVYVMFPPVGESAKPAGKIRPLEAVERVSRIAYLLVLVLLVSKEKTVWQCVWLYLAAAFLILYYAAWVRYFVHGRKVSLLGKPFLFVPMPLAVFPVLYYLFAAVWLHNLPAAGIMLVFGAAHITVSVRSFR